VPKYVTQEDIDKDVDYMQHIIEGRCLACGLDEAGLEANHIKIYDALEGSVPLVVSSETHLCYYCSQFKGIDWPRIKK